MRPCHYICLLSTAHCRFQSHISRQSWPPNQPRPTRPNSKFLLLHSRRVNGMAVQERVNILLVVSGDKLKLRPCGWISIHKLAFSGMMLGMDSNPWTIIHIKLSQVLWNVSIRNLIFYMTIIIFYLNERLLNEVTQWCIRLYKEFNISSIGSIYILHQVLIETQNQYVAILRAHFLRFVYQKHRNLHFDVLWTLKYSTFKWKN